MSVLYFSLGSVELTYCMWSPQSCCYNCSRRHHHTDDSGAVDRKTNSGFYSSKTFQTFQSQYLVNKEESTTDQSKSPLWNVQIVVYIHQF